MSWQSYILLAVVGYLAFAIFAYNIKILRPGRPLWRKLMLEYELAKDPSPLGQRRTIEVGSLCAQDCKVTGYAQVIDRGVVFAKHKLASREFVLFRWADLEWIKYGLLDKSITLRLKSVEFESTDIELPWSLNLTEILEEKMRAHQLDLIRK